MTCWKKIDVAFVEGVTRDFNVNLDKTVLCEDEIILIVGPNHKWVKEGRIRPFELLNDRMIMREEVSGTRKIVEQALSEKLS